jgi:signal peptidase I
MLTFTIVNLDRRPDGQIAHHFLVKRLIALPGEQLRMRNGKVELKRAGENEWTPEDYPFDVMRYWLSVVEDVVTYKQASPETFKNEFVQLSYNELKKFYPFAKYDLIKRYVVNQNLKLLKLPVEEKFSDMEAEYRKLAVTPRTDEYFEDYWRARTRGSVKPYDRSTRILWERRVLGWYIPSDKFFPMGDNRDNSRDARYFGPVKLDQLLGRALFRFWPPHRFGGI